MELEVKHLAPYLHYGLTFLMESEPDSKEPNIDELKSIDVGLKMVNFGWGNANFLTEIKPILKPLNTLTKEMLNQWYDGVAENEISMVSYSDDTGKAHTVSVSYKMTGDGFTDIICTRNSIQYTDYWIVQKMLENHFDVFGLIDAGLATEMS